MRAAACGGVDSAFPRGSTCGRSLSGNDILISETFERVHLALGKAGAFGNFDRRTCHFRDGSLSGRKKKKRKESRHEFNILICGHFVSFSARRRKMQTDRCVSGAAIRLWIKRALHCRFLSLLRVTF